MSQFEDFLRASKSDGSNRFATDNRKTGQIHDGGRNRYRWKLPRPPWKPTRRTRIFRAQAPGGTFSARAYISGGSVVSKWQSGIVTSTKAPRKSVELASSQFSKVPEGARRNVCIYSLRNLRHTLVRNKT